MAVETAAKKKTVPPPPLKPGKRLTRDEFETAL